MQAHRAKHIKQRQGAERGKPLISVLTYMQKNQMFAIYF